MSISVTTLVDNTVSVGKGHIGEHGLCFFIDTGDRKILFDTGQRSALENNAAVMGIDLSKIDTVILSHGHYDHAGGLASLINHTTDFTLLGHPDIFDDKRAKFADSFIPIGSPMGKKEFTEKGIEIQLSAEPVSITEQIMTSGTVPMTTDFESIEPMFYIKKEEEFAPDQLEDDLSLILDTKEGIVLLLGCAHRGLANILRHVDKLTSGKKIHAIIGGLHLANATDEKMDRIINILREYDIDKIGVSHCTGPKASAIFFKEFPDRVFMNSVANTMSFS